MLELKEISLTLGEGDDEIPLLAEVCVQFPGRHFAAIVGPSGCGKSTLLKVIAGLREPTAGRVLWQGRDLAEQDMDPHEIGYVPQFSIAFELLTVRESVEGAMRLRVAGLAPEQREARLEEILGEAGLQGIAERQVRVLSGGQRRRLALALEMVSSPHLLLCDEVTSGLDPKAEDEIARLMHKLAQHQGRIVLSVTHSLRHLELYDSITVLYQGGVAYHGPPKFLYHYFDVALPEDLFPRLAQRTAEEWRRSWLKHRTAYQERPPGDPAPLSTASRKADPNGPAQPAEELASGEAATPPAAAGMSAGPSATEDVPPGAGAPAAPDATAMPSFLSQVAVLLGRQGKLFLRDRGQVALQLALLVGFPLLVVIFALDGLPQIKNLNGVLNGNFLQQLQNEFTQQAELMRTGSLVSGLIMFQVILLALMGSNNAAREIAGERLIFEKEKFAGLRPSAYVAAKTLFLGALVLAQSVWMGVLVNFVVRFPGGLGEQILLLTLVNAALTAVCLGLSSVMKTAEQASLVSIYLVGFQLPLSGAVLALPAALAWFTRPFIASYWGWSGYVQTLRDTRFYEAVLKITQTHLSTAPLCVWVLTCHVVLGLLLAYTGCKASRWE